MSIRTAFLFAAAAAACLLFAAAPAAATHWVSYDYYAYATSSDGVPEMASAVVYDQTHCEGSASKSGSVGNWGSCTWEADHWNARVTATSASHGVKLSQYNVQTGTGRVNDSGLMDVLMFWIPAGDYPDGVTATVHGHARGSLWAGVGGSAQVGCVASFGYERYEPGVLTVATGDDATLSVDDEFALTLVLASPGSSYATPRVVSQEVHLLIHRAWSASVAYNAGGDYVTADAGVDFSEGVWVDAVTTEPALWWGSASGVFMGRVGDVPDAPSGIVLTNAPNPFNPATRISVTLPDGDVPVDLAVYDVMGRVVRVLAAGEVLGPGAQHFAWDGRDDAGRPVPSGAYLAQLIAGELRAVRPMLLLK